MTPRSRRWSGLPQFMTSVEKYLFRGGEADAMLSQVRPRLLGVPFESQHHAIRGSERDALNQPAYSGWI